MKPQFILLFLLGIILSSCNMEQNNSAAINPPKPAVSNQEKEELAEEAENIVLYKSATVYAAATDYYFENKDGETLSFRVSGVEEGQILVPENLLESIEDIEGLPAENPEMVGKEFKLIYGESGRLIEIVPN